MSRKKNPFLSAPEQSQEMSLNITAMADIFTIILVFMLKSFAGGGVGSPPLSGLTLPTSNAGEAPVEMIKLEIARDTVLLEGRPVMTLSDFRFRAEDLEADGTSRMLRDAFAIERSRAPASADPSATSEAKMMVYIDRDVPYATVKRALASAAFAGFSKFRLAVVKEEQ